MIDRRTGLICVTLIVMMLAAAVWRIVMLEDWTVLVGQRRGAILSWLPLFFPAASAFVVGRLYCGGPRTSADVASVQRWRTWGAFISISYCGLLLLLEATVIVMSIVGVQLYLWAIYRVMGVVLGVIIIVAFNQLPKLPYIERRFAPGGDLGPIYGPRYVRIKSRIDIVLVVAVIALILAATPSMDWHPALFVLVAAALLPIWSIAWRRHLGRKWRLEQLDARGFRR